MHLMGIEHGSRALRATVLKDGQTHHVTIPRTEDPDLSPILDLGKPDITVVTYSMGDSLTEIVPLEKAEDMGLLPTRAAGKEIGTGTMLVQKLKELDWPVYLVPGVHRATPWIKQPFRRYSHICAPDKVCGAFMGTKKAGEDFILVDASTNTVSVVVEGSKITGGLDALALAPGLIQGPLDLECLRAVGSGSDVEKVFSSSGLMFDSPTDMDEDPSVAVERFLQGIGSGDFQALDLLDDLCDLCTMEICALAAAADKPLEAVILAGIFAELDQRTRDHAFTRVHDRLEIVRGKAPRLILGDVHFSSDGALEMAKQICAGADTIMNFKVIRR